MKKKILFSSLFLLILVAFGYFIYRNNNQKAKYVFLFIGDGMSSAQVELTEIYHNSIQGKGYSEQDRLSFTEFPTISLRKNYSNNSYITDSAASATVLASGTLTYNGSINIDMDGSNVQPITYKLHDNNKKIGIVSTVPVNHATPAAFYGNATNRDKYDKLALDLVDSGFEFFAGGYFILNELPHEQIYNYANEKGYTIIDNFDKLKSIDKNNKNIVLNPFGDTFAMDYKTEFNLANYVQTAIDVLDNKNGFFIMAESGMIDYAGHNNDARAIISEVEVLDEAVKVALEFAKKHPKETLIVVTGDHETGGLSLGNNVHYLQIDNLQKQQYSYNKLNEFSYNIINQGMTYEELINNIGQYYGIYNINLEDVYEKTLNGNTEILKETILELEANNAGINFSSTNHTADRIPIYAYGVNNEYFSGIINIENFNNILEKAIK